MSRDEVKSLNDLAMAHGGQLTINPQTGLPEAGFLSSLLPTIAGAALTGLSGGAINPLTAGMIVGGGSYLMNPKAGLMGGLMAGLGAYGGAGLGQGLANLGTSEAGLTSGTAANDAVDTQMKQLEAQRADMLAKQQLAMDTGYGNMDPGTVKPFTADENMMNRVNLMNEYQTTPGYVRESSLANPNIGTYTPLEAPASKIPSGLEAMKQGIGSVFSDPTADKFKALGGGSWTGLARTAAMAATPAIAEGLKPNSLSTTAASQKQVVPHYGFTPGMVTPTPTASKTGVENTYFQPKYTALTNDQAQQLYPGYPAANFAGGGPVEQMSNNAAIGANTMYPMANMATSAFATPYQDPKSTNMMSAMAPSGGGTVDAMSGEPNMQGTRLASGGTAKTDTPYAAGYPGYSGGNNASTSNGPSNGSPTGSALGDFGYAVSNQNFSPIAAMVAQAIMDATSPTSQTSVNAVNGMDAQSDAASAAAAATAAADASGGAPGMGGGAGPSAPSGGDGGDGGEARGGLSPLFTHHMATGGVPRYGFGGFLGDSLSRIGSAIGHIGKSDNGGDPRGWAHLEEMMGMQRPKQDSGQTTAANVVYNPNTQQYQQMATGGLSDAHYNLGGYSDGGRLLRGPGDGVSDSIPAVIGKKQPARLADGEFVVPARIVSELGNGSTEAGARKLYAMMDRIQASRKNTVGKGKVAKNNRADKYLPA
jgi:hypothetical protein